MKRTFSLLAVFAVLGILSALVLMRVDSPVRVDIPPRGDAPSAKRPASAPRSSLLPIPRERMGQSLLHLLNNERIQQELLVTESQRAGIERLAAQCLAEVGPGLAATQPTGGRSEAKELREMKLAAFQALQTRVLNETGLLAVEVLSGEQQRRLDQILFRLRSVEIYELPEFAAALELTDEQRLSIRQIVSELQDAGNALHRRRTGGEISLDAFNRELGAALVLAESRVPPLLDALQRSMVEQWAGDGIPYTRHDLRLVLRTGNPRSGTRQASE